MTGFESWASGVGSDLSANKAQRMFDYFLLYGKNHNLSILKLSFFRFFKISKKIHDRSGFCQSSPYLQTANFVKSVMTLNLSINFSSLPPWIDDAETN